MTLDIKLDELGDRLERYTAAELRSEQRAPGAVTTWARRRRPRLLAGSSLGLAGIGATVLLALTGTAATTPAFAITSHRDGSVLVQLNRQEDIGQANQKLTAMGINEQITLYLISTPSAANASNGCIPGPGAGAPSRPIRVVVNANNAGNTGTTSTGNTGTTSTLVCVVGPHTYSGPYRG
jgi:hypothetical protein